MTIPHVPSARASSSGASPAARRWAVVAGLVIGLGGITRAIVACGPPPEGWSGAGRLQTLPALQPDAGGGSSDAGAG
jgi:hypothetical protein